MGKKYEVEIKKAEGSCDTELFKKMAKKGDIQATKVVDMIGKVVKITGYAICKIVTEDKEFEMSYYATTEGIISSGSEFFRESVEDYFGECELMKINEIKTKKGKTYKVSPILTQGTDDDLPF